MTTQEQIDTEEETLELIRRTTHPYETYTPSNQPDHDQLSAHRHDGYATLVFGGNKSGKSICAAHDCAAWATGNRKWRDDIPDGIRIWVVSAQYRTLYEGIWHHLNECLPYWLIERKGPQVAGYDMPQWVTVRTLSGKVSRIDFLSAEGGESARKRVQSASLHRLYIDEEVDDAIWQELQMRLIEHGGSVMVSATLVMSEDWLVDLEKRALSGDRQVHLSRLNTEKNPWLDATTLAIVTSDMSEEEKNVRILGRSRRTSGLIYPSFGDSHLVDPFSIPADWPRFVAYDSGFRVFAVLWLAVDPTGRRYLYRELYAREAQLADVVAQIRAAEAGESAPEVRLIDPAAFAHNQDGTMGIGPRLSSEYDMPCTPAINSVYDGIEAVRRWLLPGVDGRTGLAVFKNLVEFRREAGRYRIRAQTAERDAPGRPDEPLKKDDHLMDGLRYLANYDPRPRDMPDARADYERQIAAGQFNRGPDGEAVTEPLDERMLRRHLARKEKKNLHPVWGSEE